MKICNFAFHFLQTEMIKEKLISAIIGTLFFAVFQPFGISLFSMPERLLIICGLLVVAFASCMTSEGIVNYILHMPMDTSKGPSYTMKRGIVFQICNIIVLTVYMSLYFSNFVNSEYVDNHLNLENCLQFFVASVGCCFFIGLYWRNVYWKRHYAKQLEEAQLLNGMLMERARVTETTSIKGEMANEGQDNVATSITIEGSTKESVTFSPRDFLFAESEGNYVSIHHILNGEEKQAMLRTSLKNVAGELCTDRNIMQCHRAFIVNLAHVDRVEGRSSGIGLRLRHCSDIVPVSKGFANEVKERIKNPQQA